MSLVINHNMMAMNAARNLGESYGKLAISTRRLSSGLRVGSAADDAAGLAIRELMRADISTLQQGMRNANDAVSMLQTADGALQIIDEKLIRMKELAEQAATGTYTSDQRLLIDSEYQAMASEITRIAKATDFNGIKLLDGNLSSALHFGNGLSSSGKLKIHFGTGNDSAEDYYYIRIAEMTSEALSLGNNSSVTEAVNRLGSKFYDELYATFQPLVASGDVTAADFNDLITNYPGYMKNEILQWSIPTDQTSFDAIRDRFIEFAQGVYPYPEAGVIPEVTTWDQYQALDNFAKEQLHYDWARGAASKLGSYQGLPAPATPTAPTSISSNFQDVYQAAIKRSTDWFREHHDYEGNNIRTQENAQSALDAINKAIIYKDETRAIIGATQNRLANTISNLSIQAENLQASESRISDVDVAQEMTEFTRQQILTQGAVAMLAQANSLPRLAMQLIGGG